MPERDQTYREPDYDDSLCVCCNAQLPDYGEDVKETDPLFRGYCNDACMRGEPVGRFVFADGSPVTVPAWVVMPAEGKYVPERRYHVRRLVPPEPGTGDWQRLGYVVAWFKGAVEPSRYLPLAIGAHWQRGEAPERKGPLCPDCGEEVLHDRADVSLVCSGACGWNWCLT